MDPALISALISALVVLLGTIGWLLKLRAAMVDVYDEIRANATTLRQLEDVQSTPHPGMFSFEAHRRSGALVRQGCSRATCSAIADTYFHVARLRDAGGADPPEDLSAVTTVRITAAIRASERALDQMDRSFAWRKWRRAPFVGGTDRSPDGERSVRSGPPPAWRLLAVLAVLPALPFVIVRTSTSDDPAHGIAGAPAVAPLDPGIRSDAGGKIRLCSGSDTVESLEDGVDSFNSQFGPEGSSAKIVPFGAQADQQYEQFSAYQRDRSSTCDVLYSDVIWTADFARSGWLHDLSRYVARRKDEFVPKMLDTVTYDGRRWGVPKQADAGVLFYRKDRVGDPPQTWQELYRRERGSDGLRYQARAYEGLTVNFLELAYAAGAHDIVTADGVAQVDQFAALEALRFMVRGIRDGVAPWAVINQKEAQSRRAFLRGKADFMRNWPAAQKDIDASSIKRDVDAMSLPAWKDGNQASVLGGHNLVISRFSTNPAAALKLIHYLTQSDVIRRDAIEHAQPPVLRDLWEDLAVQRALPAFGALSDAIRAGNAEIRPVVPNYKEVSEAIYTNVNRALAGDATPEQALQTANEEMQQALDDAYRRSSR